MKEQIEEFSELVKKHIQTIEPASEIILLFPQGKEQHEEIQIYILTPQKADFEQEQRYLKACYQVELASKQNLSIYIYTSENWHKQFVNTPIYRRITNEGIRL
jgi:hypothetical protein